MFRRYRSRFSLLCTVLLLWQAGVAPLAHAAAFHGVEAVPGEPVSRPAQGQASESEPAPCHGEHGQDHSDLAGMGETPQASQADNFPDCCQSLACQCACLHASLSTVTFAVAAHVVPDHPAQLGPEMPPVRARVAEFFRPPI